MYFKKLTGILFIGLLSIFSLAVSQKMQRIPTGVWGGQHININVGENSATIEYDCASGVIDGPLNIDGEGKFKLRGTHSRERGGPLRSDDNPNREPASYTGTIKGSTMTLKLKLSESDEETFTLEKGRPGDLFKCK